jgi:hypothetical protein
MEINNGSIVKDVEIIQDNDKIIIKDNTAPSQSFEAPHLETTTVPTSIVKIKKVHFNLKDTIHKIPKRQKLHSLTPYHVSTVKKHKKGKKNKTKYRKTRIN